MTIEFTDDSTTQALVKVTGENKLTKTGYNKSFEKDGKSSYSEKVAGTETQLEEYYQDRKANGVNVSSAELSVNQGKGEITVNYGSDARDESEEGEAANGETTTPEWNMDPMLASRALAEHPYFIKYAPGAGLTIDQYIVMIDKQISKGQEYSDPSSGHYDGWLKRYYAMKACGVDEYEVLGLQLTKSYQTSSENAVIAAFTGIGQVININDINTPVMIFAALLGVERISSYASSDPSTVVYESGKWEWLKRPTTMSMGGNERSNIVRITETWWGFDRVSKVFYKGGTWDPPVTS